MEINVTELSEYLESYSIEDLNGIAKGLTTILQKYEDNLLIQGSQPRFIDHQVDLLRVVLSLSDHYHLRYHRSNLNYANYEPAAQLQELIHLLEGRIEKRITGEETMRDMDIVFKISGKGFRVDNGVVSRWIRKQLLKAYHDFDLTVEDFGEAMFLLDARENVMYNEASAGELQKYAERPISFSRLIYNFCDGVMTYMTNTFSLIPHNARYLSEQQISFLYELLCLMQYEGYSSEFDADEYAKGLYVDNLYQLLIKQRKLMS